jgi:hypothetical protein
MTIRLLARLAAASVLALMLSATSGLGVDTGGDDSNATPATPTLAQARADIDAKHWSDAIAKLTLIVKSDPHSADAYNLLGYSFLFVPQCGQCQPRHAGL